jgi:23S rRNA (cytosine1962-C5)-methyltransferase
LRVELNVDAFPGRIVYFRKMVRRSEAEPGSLVDVVDRSGKTVGVGFYNPRSELALRLLRSEEIEQTLRAAIDLREKVLRLPEITDAYRLSHAEGDGLPGLVIDRYGPMHVIELHSLGFFRLRDRITSVLGTSYVRASDEVQRLEGFRLPPTPPPEGVVIQEHGVQYRVDFARGHKTGFFCDQRENRKFLADLARGRSVLDLCTYTGGFALSAAKAGATRVVGVDLDEKVLETARQNAKLNRVKVEFLHADLFNYVRQMRESFDIIVVDPPKLAYDREELGKTKKTYFDMNYLATKVLSPGGILVSCSCSGMISEEDFLTIVRSAARESGRELRMMRIAGAGPDHPISTSYPEGRYLKVVFSQML